MILLSPGSINNYLGYASGCLYEVTLRKVEEFFIVSSFVFCEISGRKEFAGMRA